jgi:hypothetical protein
MLPKHVLYYGKDEALPARQLLRAGPLTMDYAAGTLRYLRYGEREVLRMIYVAVRDHNWNTIPAQLTQVEMQIHDDSFRIAYDAIHQQGAVDFAWHGVITGASDGALTFTLDGEARTTFKRNRIGFCILHPIRECAGQPCSVEHVDGTTEQSVFPFHIAPHQSFLDMRAISHAVAPNVRAEVRFEGDTFEIEDQRNWTDASYKIYSTPLRLPFPVEIQQGAKISQSVTLQLHIAQETTADDRRQMKAMSVHPPSSVLRLSSTVAPLPHLGLGIASHGQPLNPSELARLAALNLSHLRVDLQLAQTNYADVLRRATSEAKALGVPLEITLCLSNSAAAELKALRELLAQCKPSVCRWLIFHVAEKSTTEKWVMLARDPLQAYDARALIGAGTNAYFTELNRERPPMHALDCVCYSCNPQVHAFDNASLVEALAGQTATVESARQFVGDQWLAVGPVTLKPRFNPAATTAAVLSPDELPAQVDVRQMSLFGAVWTLGSLKALAESGANSVTYYETTGWRGVMETAQGSALPRQFQTIAGAVFPLYHVFADVGEFAGGEVMLTETSAPLAIDGLCVQKDGRWRVIIANLTDEIQRVGVQGLSEWVRVRHLNETTTEAAMTAPEEFRKQAGELLQTVAGQSEFELLPYALARIDFIRAMVM